MFDIRTYCYTDQWSISGGSSIPFDKMMENFFIQLKNEGAELVFIQNIEIESGRENLWIKRKEKQFDDHFEIYQKIWNDKSSANIVNEFITTRIVRTVSVNLMTIASKYGEFRFTRLGRHCNYEVAQYARTHNAMAIFTNDSDFLIFDGNFSFWAVEKIDYDEFTVVEYDRRFIRRRLGLPDAKRPVFATLLGNDLTHEHGFRANIRKFHKKYGFRYRKFENVAHFIKRYLPHDIVTRGNVSSIARNIFGRLYNDEKQDFISDSIRSYDVNVWDYEEPNEDLIIATLRLISLNAAKTYMKLNISTTKTLLMTFNNMAISEHSWNLTRFLVVLLQKKVGILSEGNYHDFKLIMKKSLRQPYTIYRPITVCPDPIIFGNMPDLFDLLTRGNADVELNRKRWDLLAWMLRISHRHCDILRQLVGNEFRVPCATLLTLVEVSWIAIIPDYKSGFWNSFIMPCYAALSNV